MKWIFVVFLWLLMAVLQVIFLLVLLVLVISLIGLVVLTQADVDSEDVFLPMNIAVRETEKLLT